MADPDIWRTASALLDEHGDAAGFRAAMEADDKLDAGDLDGQRFWKAVLRAIDEIERQKLRKGEALN